jgi:transcriptional regulator with XRE-family HTH domain
MQVASPCDMADLKDVVAVNVRRLRHDKGWTQEDLADRVGLSARYVGQIERAQASMTVSVLGRIANALRVEPTEMLKRPSSKP